MYADETVPVRIPRYAMRTLRRLKARRMLEEGARVSDAKVIAEALEFEERYEHVFKKRKKSKSILDYVGFIKGGPRTNSAIDVDEFLYGDELD